MRHLLTAAMFLICSASSSGAPPEGLFCSCPPTTGGSHSVIPEVAMLPFVDGVLVRVPWELLEPSPGVYDWSLLDNELSLAESLGTSVALAIVCGGTAEPAWVYAPHDGLPGAEPFTYQFHGDAETMPVPWDESFLTDWTAFITELGDRYRDRQVISLVHVTHSTLNGFEMQIPFSPSDEQQWLAIGYETSLHTASWLSVIDAFATAFPDTPLDLECHPVLGSAAVAEQAVAHGAASLGDRFGVLAAWWTEHNALDVYPEMFDLLTESAQRSFATVQFARSYTLHGDASFGVNGFAGTLDLALGQGIRYAEIWNNDLLNPELAPVLQAAWHELHACPGDFDGDGVIDTRDVLAFLAAWARGDPEADFNGDGIINTADVLAFLNAWSAGC